MKELKCQHCGNDEEFYTKEKYRGEFEYKIDKFGVPTYNADMYQNATYSYRSKYIFCAECNKRVCKIEDFYKNNINNRWSNV